MQLLRSPVVLYILTRLLNLYNRPCNSLPHMLFLEHCIISINNSNFQIFSKKIFYISIVLKILWKMEHLLLLRSKCSIFHNILKILWKMEHLLLLRSKCSIFHNIFKNLKFQRRPKELVWRKGLTIIYDIYTIDVLRLLPTDAHI